MLGKLIKNEIKHSVRYVSIIYSCTAAAIATMFLSMLFKVTWLTAVCIFLSYIIGLALVIMTIVAVIKNFYETLYSRQGYLTFTLPVKTGQLLFSKVVVSFLWITVSGILTGLIFFMTTASVSSLADGSAFAIIDMIKESGILQLLPNRAVLLKFIVVICFSALLHILTFVGFIYFSVTLSNTRALQKHPKLYGFIIFYLTYAAASVISTVLTYRLPLSVSVTQSSVSLTLSSMYSEGSVFNFGLGGTVMSAIIAVALLLVTGYIMEKKVNIK